VSARFAVTRWSIVLAAGGDSAGARAALAWLCERYWEPLRAHAQRRGWHPASADDLVQQLFCDLIERGGLASADPRRGRFRTWLLACLDHCAARECERRRAAKRGGGTARVDPAAVEPLAPALVADFDRDWAQALLERSLARLMADYRSEGKGAVSDALRPYLGGDADGAAVAAIAASLGMTAGAVRVALHRLRSRFGDAVRAELTETLSDPTDQAIADELAALQVALGR
jgi:DNA-directed RNA polymerase specialized sigma24 family protein